MKIEEVLTKIDAATTEAGTRIQNLIDSIKANGAVLTPAQEAEANTIIEHLAGLGSDPSNPVPPIAAAPADLGSTGVSGETGDASTGEVNTPGGPVEVNPLTGDTGGATGTSPGDTAHVPPGPDSPQSDPGPNVPNPDSQL